MNRSIKPEIIDDHLLFSNEVKEAVFNKKPLVALESTIISHGLPYPQNIETALHVETIIRQNGAIPATIALLNGKIHIGLSENQIEEIANPSNHRNVLKVSRRDLAYALSTKQMGSTTVAGTMICAELAGIRTFVTGGIGGVHRDAENTFDISADLQELGRTSVAVVCAGAKSILDIPKTLEVLETLGVPVIGYKTDRFPEFYCQGQIPLDLSFDHVHDMANMISLKWQLGITGGAIIANPLPVEDSLDRDWIHELVEEGIEDARKNNIKGKALTPYLLSFLTKQSHGKTLRANIALISNNAKLGAHFANALNKVPIHV